MSWDKKVDVAVVAVRVPAEREVPKQPGRAEIASVRIVVTR